MRLGEAGAIRSVVRVLASALTIVAASASAAALAAPAASAAGPAANVARLGAAPASQRLALVLPLVADRAGLERFARSVTTEHSPEYGQYEPIAQLASRFGASARTRETVIRYLRAAGATSVRIDATGLFADATISAGQARRLFGTPLEQFSTDRGTRYTAPAGAARIPSALRGLVTTVVGLDDQPLSTQAEPFDAGADLRTGAAKTLATDAASAHEAVPGQPSSVVAHSGTAAGCVDGQTAGEMDNDPRTDAFTPNQYLTAYGFDGVRAPGSAGAGERVALIEIDGFKASDIRTFAACFGLDIPRIEAFGVGINRALPPGSESTLDVEVLDAAAPDLSGIDVYETKPAAATTLRAITAPLENKSHHPQVISVSLGLCEPEVAQAIGIKGLETIEDTLEMAAASGTTVLASTGDQGSADCTGADGVPIRHLAVNYPASSPWVTGVGGTNITLDANNALTGQVVWNDTGALPGAAGGGGLSALFRRPFYQDGVDSNKARAVPDVAMLGDVIPGFAVFCSAAKACVSSAHPNAWGSVGGTSAGTPLLAGGLALVDQSLKAHDREPLGFVNPLLYTLGRSPTAASQVFSDVVAWGNDVGPYIGGSGKPLGCCTAKPGYDDASGLGSVNLANLTGAADLIQPVMFHISLAPHQHPLRSHRIVTTISCAGACRVGAFALIQIGKNKPAEQDSKIFQLAAAGKQKVTIKLSKKELSRLRSASRHHQRIAAEVYGVALTGKTVLAQTRGMKLKI
jgi:kumamolisin